VVASEFGLANIKYQVIQVKGSVFISRNGILSPVTKDPKITFRKVLPPRAIGTLLLVCHSWIDLNAISNAEQFAYAKESCHGIFEFINTARCKIKILPFSFLSFFRWVSKRSFFNAVFICPWAKRVK
jgi:hypothetical protein